MHKPRNICLFSCKVCFRSVSFSVTLYCRDSFLLTPHRLRPSILFCLNVPQERIYSGATSHINYCIYNSQAHLIQNLDFYFVWFCFVCIANMCDDGVLWHLRFLSSALPRTGLWQCKVCVYIHFSCFVGV